MKTFFKNRLTGALCIFALGTLFISSCKKDEVEPVVYGDARIRVVHAVRDLPSQDVYQNDVAATGGTVSYGNATNYLTIKAGPSTVALKATGTTTATLSVGANLPTNGVFTVFFVNNGLGGTELNALSDDNVAVASKAKIRFLNLAPNAISVSLAAGTSVISGLTSRNVSAYQTIDPELDLKFTATGSSSVTIPGANFVAGKNYTVWFDAVDATTVTYHVILQN